MTLQFSHRHHIGCCISKGKVARYDLVLLRDFCDIVFCLVDWMLHFHIREHVREVLMSTLSHAE